MLEEGRLVGRDPEVAALGAALDRTEDGPMQAIAIVGEPGIGKTRLLAELRSMASERGFTVVHAVGSEFEAYVPYAVVMAALDPYVSPPDSGTEVPA